MVSTFKAHDKYKGASIKNVHKILPFLDPYSVPLCLQDLASYRQNLTHASIYVLSLPPDNWTSFMDCKFLVPGYR